MPASLGIGRYQVRRVTSSFGKVGCAFRLSIGMHASLVSGHTCAGEAPDLRAVSLVCCGARGPPKCDWNRLGGRLNGVPSFVCFGARHRVEGAPICSSVSLTRGWQPSIQAGRRLGPPDG
ncbi:hypothetical protein CVN56_31235 [Rhodococcus sp. AQ5-07]|nr:hypothetical protein CVN56_31235 [Rhodococcus sp. AQ5-07]